LILAFALVLYLHFLSLCACCTFDSSLFVPFFTFPFHFYLQEHMLSFLFPVSLAPLVEFPHWMFFHNFVKYAVHLSSYCLIAFFPNLAGLLFVISINVLFAAFPFLHPALLPCLYTLRKEHRTHFNSMFAPQLFLQ